jgi:hypothetical protein
MAAAATPNVVSKVGFLTETEVINILKEIRDRKSVKSFPPNASTDGPGCSRFLNKSESGSNIFGAFFL